MLQTSRLPGTILILDADNASLNSLTKLFQQKGYRVQQAMTGQIALATIYTEQPDLVLMDLALPDINGYDICRALKSLPDTCEIPIICISNNTDLVYKTQAFEVGVSDYVVKPFGAQEISVRVSNQLALQSIKRENYQLQASLSLQTTSEQTQSNGINNPNPQGLSATSHSLSLNGATRFYDTLTGLPNRCWVKHRLAELLLELKKISGQQRFVLCLDLDRFRLVNDSLGHSAGDYLLLELVQRLKAILRSKDTIVRLGGDEFMLLLESVSEPEHAVSVARRVLQCLKVPFSLKHQEVFIDASIGIVKLTQSYEDPEVVLRDADIAMNQAKAAGKGCYCSFMPDMHQRIQQALQLETDLRHAVMKGVFKLYYQPIFSLRTNHVIGFEALLRWRQPEHGYVSPADFIPIAEETGLIIPIGRWVLQEACRQFKVWRDRSLVPTHATISVNLSAKQLAQPDLIQQIDQILQETGLDGTVLKVEVTESALIENTELASQKLWQLREREIKVALDDFGTGYSSLSHLYHLPIDTLKLDRSFVSRLGKEQEDLDLIRNLEIIRALISMAMHLGLSVTAEGIETEEQLRQIKDLNCGLGQGYLWSRALPAELVEIFLKEYPNSISLEDSSAKVLDQDSAPQPVRN
jgi:diguanylate cyclase (GGDEF)-like protein